METTGTYNLGKIPASQGGGYKKNIYRGETVHSVSFDFSVNVISAEMRWYSGSVTNPIKVFTPGNGLTIAGNVVTMNHFSMNWNPGRYAYKLFITTDNGHIHPYMQGTLPQVL